MNNRINKISSIVMLLLFMGYGSMMQAQYMQPVSGSESYTLDCGAEDSYYDEGGVDGNYSTGTNSTIEFCANDPACYITVEFTAFDVEASSFTACWDNLTVTGDVNGNDGEYSGDDDDGGSDLNCTDATDVSGAPSTPVFQSADGGCISFTFSSDGSVTQSGWEATVTAVGQNPGGGDDTGECALQCEQDQTIQLGVGECSYTLPQLASTTGDCAPAIPTPEEIVGIDEEFDFSSYTLYDDFTSFFAGSYPKTVNSSPSTFNVPDEATLIVDSDSGFAFGVFSLQIPFTGTLTFDYEINGVDGTLYYTVGDPETEFLNYIDGQFGTDPQSGTFTIDLAEDDYFSLAPGALFFGDESEVTITNLTFVEEVGAPIPYEVVLESATMDGEPAEIAQGDDLAPGEYEFNYQLVNPEGEVIDECSSAIIVIENAVNGGSLSCNDEVNISADEICSVYLEADMFLEGSNYGCFEDLVIDIWVNNNPSNVIADVNGQTIDFSDLLGQHTFNITNPDNGNKCWGYFTVEDKQPPVADCPCSSAAEESDVITGFLAADSPTFSRWSGSFNQPVTNCTTQAASTYRYVAIPFQVSETGYYEFEAEWIGDAHGAIFEGSFDPDDACANLVESNDDGAGGLDPLITVNLEAGVNYIYVMTTWSAFNTQEGEFTVTIRPISDGLFLEGEADCIFNCTDIDLVLNSTALTPNPAVDTLDNCGIAESTYTDELEKSDCGQSTITRTWLFTDHSGNSATCQQVFTFNSIGINQIEYPVTPVILGCGADLTPAGIAGVLGIDYGSPYVITQDITGAETLTPITDNVCSIYTSYTDQDLKACGDDCYGNRKVIRTWTVFDWCDQVQETFVQIIKSVDDEGPTFAVNDTVVSTRPWDCTAEFVLPDVWELHDNCDDNPTYTVTGPVGVNIEHNYDLNGKLVNIKAYGAPKGNHVFTYTATDCCDNTTKHDIVVVVKDLVAPVVTTKQDIVVSLTPGGDSSGQYEGQAKLQPRHLDNGSYDMCTDVRLEIRREDGEPSCGNIGLQGHNNNITFNNDRHDSDNNNDTDDGQFVKFCCEDLYAEKHDVNGDGVNDRGYVKVILRVWDDADMNGVYGTDGDNYNEGWSFVKVEDKLPPVLTCPDDATIYCDWPIDMSSDFGNGYVSADQADFTKTGKATAYGVCSDIPVDFRDQAQLDQCGVGTIKRTWRATAQTATGPKVVTCDQIITVEPRETNFSVSEPQRNRQWDSCTLDESQIPASHKPQKSSGTCDVIGENIKIDTFLFEDGVCKKWKVTYNYVNWCTGEEAGPFEVYYFFDDESKPVIAECDDKMHPVDANCEHVFVVKNSATDNGGCVDGGWLKWQLFVDTWADGSVDYYASTFKGNQRPSWSIVPKYNSNGTINQEWLQLPNGHNWADIVYVNGIDPTADGEEVSVEIEKITGSMSNHKVKWKVTDGCHNYATCQYNVMIVDKKAPTPYCVDISTALMQGADKMVELWAVDFDRGAFDNCTPQDWLAFTFFGAEPQLKDTIIIKGNKQYLVNRHVPHYFDQNNTFVDFDSDGVTPWTDGIVYPKTKSSTITAYSQGIDQQGNGVQIWKPADRTSGAVFRTAGVWSLNVSVWDEKCNTDFCTVTLSINDNDNDNGPGGLIGGDISTEDGVGVADVQVTNTAPIQEYPTQVMSTATGSYVFPNNPQNFNYNISPAKTDNKRNGVSTIDLVIVQRHILGSQLLDSPYKVIAADMNDNQNIEPLDLLIMRKLILNISDNTGNSSWRFVDASQTWADPMRPWPFKEDIDVSNFSSSVTDVDFVAVKIGDVNGSATPRNNTPVVVNTQDRSVVKGEEVTISLSNEQFTEVYGTQFTLEHKGLRFDGMSSDVLDLNENLVGRASESMTNFSIVAPYGVSSGNQDAIINLTFVATQDGQLSKMIGLSERGLDAEIYVTEELVVRPLELRFEDADSALAFDLLQNEPNPFKDRTTIGFYVPQAGKATIQVANVTGQILYNSTVEAVAGYNEVTLNNSDVSQSGVLYYTVESGDYTATKKMISIK